MIHRIRLRAPWQSARIQGATRFFRQFNCPSGITSQTGVALVLQSHTGSVVLHLNGQRLGETDIARNRIHYPIKQDLKPHNEIWIDIRDTENTGKTSAHHTTKNALPTPAETYFEVHLEMTENG